MCCLGGDGVLLHASTLFPAAVPPLISFALGSLGFLTTHDFDDFKEDLRLLIDGDERSMGGVYITLRMRLRRAPRHRASPRIAPVACTDAMYVTSADAVCARRGAGARSTGRGCRRRGRCSR